MYSGPYVWDGAGSTLSWLKEVHTPVAIRNIWEWKTKLVFTLEPILAEKLSKIEGFKSSSVIMFALKQPSYLWNNSLQAKQP